MARKDIGRVRVELIEKINPILKSRVWQALQNWRAHLLIRGSGIFDDSFYRSQISEHSNGHFDSIRHYIEFGGSQGFDPNPYFSTNYYLQNNPDVAASGINPLAHYLLYGAAEGRDPSASFHTAFYLDANPEVREAAQNPLAHYVTVGHIERRRTRAFEESQSQIPFTRPRCLPLNNFRVTYISGLPSTPSHRYRVDHQVAALRDSGFAAQWFRWDEAHRHEEEIASTDVLVLFRVAWDTRIAEMVKLCRSLGAVVVYDVDDYVFSPEISTPKFVDGIRFLKPEDLRRYYDGVKRYREALLSCDFGIFTTPYLAERAADLGRPVHVLPNGFDHRTRQISEKLLQQTRTERRSSYGNRVTIGYISGTLTHQSDFRSASPGLLKVLEENSHVLLRIVGQFDLREFPEFHRYGERVEQFPLVDYYELPAEFARLDVHIAPLEIGNPFCESKSELKFYEGALLEVPLVASATDTFKRCIEHGRTGFLVRTPEEWRVTLNSLVRDPGLRKRVGRAARLTALERYGPAHKRSATVEVFRQITLKMRLRRGWEGEAMLVTIILPPMLKGGGGHHKLIEFAKLISKHGYAVMLQFTEATAHYPTPEHISNEFGLGEHRINVVYSPVLKFNSDITICSFWKTVASVKKSKCSAGHVFYFLQDYEPYFYPMGTEYLEAVATFYEPFHRISSGPWIQALLKKRHGLTTDFVPFCFDKSIYHLLPGVQRDDRTILFVTQPAKPRRCFELGIRALERFFEKYAMDAKVAFFGSNEIRNFNFPFPYVDKGILSPEELCHLYNQATVAIVLSATNLSYLPYEMMACGLPVLDLDLEDSVLNYGSRDNVFLAPVDVDKFADTIHAALINTEAWHKVASNGYEFAMNIPGADETVRQLLEIVERDLAENVEISLEGHARCPQMSTPVSSSSRT